MILITPLDEQTRAAEVLPRVQGTESWWWERDILVLGDSLRASLQHFLVLVRRWQLAAIPHTPLLIKGISCSRKDLDILRWCKLVRGAHRAKFP